MTVEVCGNLKGTLLRNFNPLKENTYEGNVRGKKKRIRVR
jgi:hypothetical protein